MSGPDPITIDPIIVEPTLFANPLAVTDELAAVACPAAPRPDYLVPLELTGYGTKITRIGGDVNTATAIGGIWTNYARHRPYQFWNDDMTMCGPLYQNQNDSPYHTTGPWGMVLDGESYLPIIGSNRSTNNNSMISPSFDFRWRPRYPEQALYWHPVQQILRVSKVVSRDLVSQYIFSGVHGSFGMLGAGAISADGRFVVMCTRLNSPQKTGQVDYFCIVDLEAAMTGPFSGIGPFISARMPIPTKDFGDIDWCSISPLGDYVVIKYSSKVGIPAVARCFDVDPDTLDCTPRVFSAGDNPLRSVTVPTTDPADPASAPVRALKGWMMNHSRGELAISADGVFTGAPGSGEEVLVGGIRDAATSNHCSNAEKAAHGKIVAQSLRTGRHLHVSMGTAQLGGATECEDEYTSARCYREPNKILHTYAYHATNKFADEMVIWPTLLNGGGVPVRCGTTRNSAANAPYWGPTRAVPSPGCEKIVFASNWQRNANPAGPSGDWKSYILEPTSVAVVQESDYVIEVQPTPEPVGTVSEGDAEPTPEQLRYFKK